MPRPLQINIEMGGVKGGAKIANVFSIEYFVHLQYSLLLHSVGLNSDSLHHISHQMQPISVDLGLEECSLPVVTATLATSLQLLCKLVSDRSTACA